MIEETDYSEEAKFNLFESVRKERLDWARCIMARTAPSYEDVKREMEKKDLSISRDDYKKLIKELGFS